MTIREEVLETIIDTISRAEERGEDGWKVVSKTFPGTPEVVYWDAWCRLDHRRVESWWERVERTIDGEIIKSALLKGSSSEQRPSSDPSSGAAKSARSTSTPRARGQDKFASSAKQTVLLSKRKAGSTPRTSARSTAATAS